MTWNLPEKKTISLFPKQSQVRGDRDWQSEGSFSSAIVESPPDLLQGATCLGRRPA